MSEQKSNPESGKILTCDNCVYSKAGYTRCHFFSIFLEMQNKCTDYHYYFSIELEDMENILIDALNEITKNCKVCQTPLDKI